MKQFFILIIIILKVGVFYSQENNALLCSDGIDNDGDGMIDCDDEDCISIPNEGCTVCTSGLSFADLLIEYQSGCDVVDLQPQGALGVADYWGNNEDEFEFVFLGEGGMIKLGFTDNFLSNSGDSNIDLYVFEVGSLVEPLSISLRPSNTVTELKLIGSGLSDLDGDGYYFIANLGGATSAVDLDVILTGYDAGELLFDAVEIMDLPDIACAGPTPGADIDAVCAIYSIDCAGTHNGSAIVDDCGECLEVSDPNFNMSCVDCLSQIDGEAVFDDCGVCLEISDPEFNTSCLDCLGILNGTAVIDECGECLEPNDPNFNMSCLDCHGVINGLAVVDECGECLDPTDVEFNTTCADCLGVPNGDAVFDDCGVCLSLTDPEFNMSCTDCLGVMNGNAVIDNCGECLDLLDPNINMSCADCLGVPNGTYVIDECGECLDVNDPNFSLNCRCCEVYIPNVFSPNGDGSNDVFKLFPCVDNDIFIRSKSIYDRWGNLVYIEDDFSPNKDYLGWNGESQGQELVPGVYIYSVELICKNETKFYSGSITLLR